MRMSGIVGIVAAALVLPSGVVAQNDHPTDESAMHQMPSGESMHAMMQDMMARMQSMSEMMQHMHHMMQSMHGGQGEHGAAAGGPALQGTPMQGMPMQGAQGMPMQGTPPHAGADGAHAATPTGMMCMQGAGHAAPTPPAP